MVARKFLLSKSVAAAIFVAVFNVGSANGNWLPWRSEAQLDAISLKEFESFWVDASDVLANLDSYDKLWIKPHSCVWSECTVDDTDDNYMGDNRDGDEQWYQYRTQGFCANAAYSLYGQKKEDEVFPSFLGCTRRHFINSFFTYGGADNLLQSVGETPVAYTYDDYDNDGNGNANDDDSTGLTANAVCVEIDYEAGDDDSDDDSDDENNGGGSNDKSGSNDNDGYSGTLGCGPNGEYLISAFQSSSCDGNYFAGVVNEFEEYNEQHNSIGCHNIYEKDNEVSVENVTMLLSNSWSCDLRLYPDGCPDPYGKKEKYNFAIRTVVHGGNPKRAYRNMLLKAPLHIASWVLLVVTILIFFLTYLVKNESRAIESKGGKNTMGYLRCIGEDIAISWGHFCEWVSEKWRTFVALTGMKWNGMIGRTSTEDDRFYNEDEDCGAVGGENSYVKVDENLDNKPRVGLHRSATASGGIESVASGSLDKDDKDKSEKPESDISKSRTW
eukprot:CAMPEP_0172366148 /NCGR_PEP_ID=MMETSP1060-20121228/13748_1 /TAXON_ID=37318 /ORGANISM="Pseudo-nitzschia pungens, Strain cf. cingulata" /LENGTH=497 /DNA_ID=CAMNT_0013089875 /DNA_START=14 /DNA_END=1504 /DNA_ORIENTATION=+